MSHSTMSKIEGWFWIQTFLDWLLEKDGRSFFSYFAHKLWKNKKSHAFPMQSQCKQPWLEFEHGSIIHFSVLIIMPTAWRQSQNFSLIHSTKGERALTHTQKKYSKKIELSIKNCWFVYTNLIAIFKFMTTILRLMLKKAVNRRKKINGIGQQNNFISLPTVFYIEQPRTKQTDRRVKTSQLVNMCLY